MTQWLKGAGCLALKPELGPQTHMVRGDREKDGGREEKRERDRESRIPYIVL